MFIFRACIKIQFIFSDIRTMWANMIIKNGFKNEIFFFILFSFDVIFQNLFKNREPIPFEDNKNKVDFLLNYVLMIIFFLLQNLRSHIPLKQQCSQSQHSLQCAIILSWYVLYSWILSSLGRKKIVYFVETIINIIAWIY